MSADKPQTEQSKPSCLLTESDFNSAGFSSYADLRVTADHDLRRHMFAEIAVGLEERGIEYRLLPVFDLRARFIFKSPEDRQALYDVMMDDDFSFRILKRQEGILLPRPKITPKDEISELSKEQSAEQSNGQIVVPPSGGSKPVPDVS